MALPECPRAAIGIALDRPEPGHFAIRLGRLPAQAGRRMGGVAPWVPALIYSPCPFIEPDPYADYPRPEDWFDPVGKPAGPLRARIGEKDIESAEMIIKLWQGARAITPAQHSFLVARRRWARRNDPDSYHARSVELGALKNREVL